MTEQRKAYALNDDGPFDEPVKGYLDLLMYFYNTEDKRELIGKHYFEGDVVTIPTRRLVDIAGIVSQLNETAWEESGEYADEWPDLSREEEKELEDLIVGYLEKKHAPEFYKVVNIVKKTITADDLHEPAGT
jgi:hypothetical protein